MAARDRLVEAGFLAPVWGDLTVNNPARPRGGNFDEGVFVVVGGAFCE